MKGWAMNEGTFFTGLLLAASFPFVAGVALQLGCRMFSLRFPGWTNAFLYSFCVGCSHAGGALLGVFAAGFLSYMLDVPSPGAGAIITSGGLTVSLLAGMIASAWLYNSDFSTGVGKALILWLIQVLVTSVLAGIVVGAVYFAVHVK
jgi:hypothetical protein